MSKEKPLRATTLYPIKAVSGLDMAFPATVMDMMPAYKDIPEHFKRRNTKWNKLCSDWFFFGVRDLNLTPRDGVDRDAALRHIKCIMGSLEPKHEHKEAGVAYLLDQWFSDGTWKTAKE